MTPHVLRSLGLLAIAASFGTLVAGCGRGTAASVTASTKGSGRASISATSFTDDFSTMVALKPVAAAGTGKVAVILPDATSSPRYTEFDGPDITEALQKAGLPASDLVPVQNAQGSDTTELTDAQNDIADGATVLLLDPLDSGVGTAIESYAKSHAVTVIDYDRFTAGGSRAYYVGFNPVEAGKTLGRGFVTCIGTWRVPDPQVVVMPGPASDPDAAPLYRGSVDDVLQPYFTSGRYSDVVTTAGTSDPTAALTEFEQAYASHPRINAALVAGDGTAAPVIGYLRAHGVKPRTFPTTGLGTSLTGLDDVLSGYQCGTVYEPISPEAQAAAALALYVRDGETPPSALVNGTTVDDQTGLSVPSVLLTPEWVTAANMKDTVIADHVVRATQLCAPPFASDCAAAGITS